MKKLSFEWNCVIEAEEQRAHAPALAQLIELHRNKIVEVGILTTALSENTRLRTFPQSTDEFFDRIADLGWNDLPLIKSPMALGLTFLDRVYLTPKDGVYERLVEDVWTVLASKTPRNPAEFAGLNRKLTTQELNSPELYKWRNIWCDVHNIVVQILSGRDALVTNNQKDFQKHFDDLKKLGLQSVVTPTEAVCQEVL